MSAHLRNLPAFVGRLRFPSDSAYSRVICAAEVESHYQKESVAQLLIELYIQRCVDNCRSNRERDQRLCDLPNEINAPLAFQGDLLLLCGRRREPVLVWIGLRETHAAIVPQLPKEFLHVFKQCWIAVLQVFARPPREQNVDLALEHSELPECVAVSHRYRQKSRPHYQNSPEA